MPSCNRHSRDEYDLCNNVLTSSEMFIFPDFFAGASDDCHTEISGNHASLIAYINPAVCDDNLALISYFLHIDTVVNTPGIGADLG